MKYGIMRGHNTKHNQGASGIRKEDAMINEVALILMGYLSDLGHEVCDCTPDYDEPVSTTDSLRLRCEKANAHDVDLVVSIHFNCYNGDANGCEVLYVSENGKRYATPVQAQLRRLGFADRGVKQRRNLYVLNHTNAPAILVEGCFCDSEIDMAIYNAEEMANAICTGLTGKTTKSIDWKAKYEALKRNVMEVLERG